MFYKLMHAIVLATAKCNLNCSFCSAKWLDNKAKSLEAFEYYQLFDCLSEMKVQSVGLVGGEPLLCDNILHYIRYLKNKKMTVSMSTNGILITEQIISLLQEAGLDRLQFSLDGPEHIHDRMRGRAGIYRSIIDGITICNKNNLKSSIMMTVNENNLEYIEDIIHLAKQLEVSVFIERMIGPKPSNFYETYRKKMLQISGAEKYSGFVFTNDPCINATVHNNIFDGMVWGGCTAGILSCTISSTGDVLACPNLPVVAGNIRTSLLKDIWENASLFIKLRKKEFPKDSKCSMCDKNKLCSGCRADAFCYSGQLLGDDPICLLRT